MVYPERIEAQALLEMVLGLYTRVLTIDVLRNVPLDKLSLRLNELITYTARKVSPVAKNSNDRAPVRLPANECLIMDYE